MEMGTVVKGTTAGTCPAAMKATSNGVFGGENPLEFALPLAIIQICLVLFVSRLLAFLLRPMRQPRVVAEIVGGILLGPSALGRITAYKNTVFPARSLTVLETIANLGLIFFLFLTGLEIDLPSLRRTGNKSAAIAAVGMILPFALGVASSFSFPEFSSGDDNRVAFVVFMGVALSITAFGVLARILAELKLLTTDLGRIAMSAAALNDVIAWVVLALAVALAGDKSSPLVPVWVLLTGIAFVIACVLVIPPVLKFVSPRCENGEPVDEIYICGALSVVLIAGFATDAIGIHAIFGAFVVGVLFPKGHFADAMVEKTEDIVTGLLLPLYFVLSGLKTDVTTIRGLESWGRLFLVIATACLGKVVGTVGVSLLCKFPFGESLALGVLMNTKGLTELIVLNIGKDRKVLGDQTFAIMVLMAIFTTFVTTPIVMAFYKPAGTTQMQETDSSGSYKKRERKIERDDGSKTQLRLMLCLHSTRDVNPMINIIEASRGIETKELGLKVYAMHLTELSERPSSIRMVHKARRNGLLSWNKSRESNSDTVVLAFETFGRLSRVSVRSVTAISPLSTIHEDIYNSAAQKNAAMVILPFHKQWRPLEKSFEVVRTELQMISKKVLENSPCSVGFLVDRGLGCDSPATASNFSLSITVLFFGGCDDREALAYGLRIAEHPGVSLTVVAISADFSPENSRIDILEEQEMSQSPSDSQVIAGVKKKAMSRTNSIIFEEKSAKSSEEVVEIMQESCRNVNLVLVGRSPESAVVSSLTVKKIECSELGLVGNLMLSNEISTSVSVLVVQQYTGKNSSGSGAVAAAGSARVAVAETP